MTKLFLAAGVAALAFAAPVSAERGGKQDRGGQSAKAERNGGGGQRAERRSENRMERRAERRVERREMRREARAERRPERREMRVERRAERRDMRVERRAERREVRAERRPQRVERREARMERRPERIERREERRVARVERRDDRRMARVERRDDRQMLGQDRRGDRFEQRVARRADRRDDRLQNLRFAQLGDRRIVLGEDVRDFNPRVLQGGNFSRFINGCPPGLVSHDGACWPRGQFKKLMIGQSLPAAYSERLLPLGLRDIYRDSDDYYYRYDDDYVYRVDRGSNLVAALLPLIGGGYSVGQLFPTSYMNSYVPSYYRSFYPDTADDYYRYHNGYVYEVDADSGYIEDMIPMYGYGYGVGDMLPAGYSYYNVPYQYRDYYADNDDYYYRYAPGAIYQVDRSSNLITAVASLLSGGMSVGQQLPVGYDVYNVPYAYRDRYYDTDDSWYRYSNGNIYQVDPTTRLITAVIDALV